MPPKSALVTKGKPKGKSQKPTKPAPTPEQVLKTKFRRLHDQLQDGFMEKGLKTCDQILALSPKDSTVLHTKSQLLLSLDRFPEAMSILNSLSLAAIGDEKLKLAKAYCLYKQGKEADALVLIEECGMDDETERGFMALRAQTMYRLERYEEAQELYEDLLATCEPDHPEQEDLTNNLEATQSRLTFNSEIPSLLTTKPNLNPDTLESIPLAPLVNAQENFKPQSNALAVTIGGGTGSKKRKLKEPKALDPSRPKPDPERWLPKRQRTGFVPQRSKQKARRDKAKQKVATQGSAAPVPQDAPPQSSAGGGKNKKKKGGR